MVVVVVLLLAGAIDSWEEVVVGELLDTADDEAVSSTFNDARRME